MKKWLWLLIGMLCGASLSSLALESKSPQKVTLTLPAVSEDDAVEKAREMLRDGNLGKLEIQSLSQVVAVGSPLCHVKSGPVELFLCEAPVTLVQ